MKVIATLSVLIACGMALIALSASAYACPPGRITCAEWCAKYRNKPGSTCITGSQKSCDKKPEGLATCLLDQDR
jgi:hypothetical protein